jgi:branched-chain amino acid transport system permease protein
MERLRASWTLIVAIGIVTALGVGATVLPTAVARSITLTLILMVFVVGLWMFVGNSGVLSFGHVAFMAIGAYASALVTIPTQQKSTLLPDLPSWLGNMQLGFWPGLLVGGCVAALAAAVLSVPIVRLNGIAAAIATLALLVIVNIVLSNWDSVTRGYRTMLGLPRDTTTWSAWLCVVVTLLAGYSFKNSRFGLRLRASRDDEPAAVGSGVRVQFERWLAFTLSAFFAGICGALYGAWLGVLQPDIFYFTLSFTTLAMLIVGGRLSLAGAVVGVVAIQLLTEVARFVEGGFSIGSFIVPEHPGLRDVLIAAALLVTLLSRPAGLMQGREFQLPHYFARARGTPVNGSPTTSTRVRTPARATGDSRDD